MGGGRLARLSIFLVVQPEGLRLVGLVTVAVVIDVARAFQRDSVRRLRTGLLRLLWLRFGGGRFHGFVGLAGVGTAD